MTGFRFAPLLLLILSLPVALAVAQGTHRNRETARSAYAGQEERSIKALDARSIEELKQGAGMGLAKAAELNHYPGPRHVMDLAGDLHLTREQLAATDAVFNAMRERAVELGEAVLAREQELDAAFASGHIASDLLTRLTTEIGTLQGRLRDTHLQAHLEMKRILTARQVEAYDRLRGYGDAVSPDSEKLEHSGSHRHGG